VLDLCCKSTGTTLRYKPGFIVGGEITHDCGKSRGIGYFLEPLVCIALFGRKVGDLLCLLSQPAFKLSGFHRIVQRSLCFHAHKEQQHRVKAIADRGGGGAIKDIVHHLGLLCLLVGL